MVHVSAQQCTITSSTESHASQVMDMKEKQADYYDSYMVNCPVYWKLIMLAPDKHCLIITAEQSVCVGHLLMPDAETSIHHPLTGKTGSIVTLRSVRVTL